MITTKNFTVPDVFGSCVGSLTEISSDIDHLAVSMKNRYCRVG